MQLSQTKYSQPISPRFGQLSKRMEIVKFFLSNENHQEFSDQLGIAFAEDQAKILTMGVEQIFLKLDVAEIDAAEEPKKILRSAAMKKYYQKVQDDISKYVLLRTGETPEFWLSPFSAPTSKGRNNHLNEFNQLFDAKAISDASETENPTLLKEQREIFASKYTIPNENLSSLSPAKKIPTDKLNSYKRQKSTVRDAKVEGVLKELHHPALVDMALTSVDEAIKASS